MKRLSRFLAAFLLTASAWASTCVVCEGGLLTAGGGNGYGVIAEPVKPVRLANELAEETSDIAPAISFFSASQTAISNGGSSTLSWSVSGSPIPSLWIDPGIGAVSGSSIAVSPSDTTTYTLTASNRAGIASAQTHLAVDVCPFPGDVTGFAVESNGWVADVYVSGLSTGGTYLYGLGTNDSFSGAERLRIGLTSPGYDDAGASNNLSRLVVGTKRLRFPFPYHTNAYEIPYSGGVMLRIALSDFIHSTDTITNVSIASGLYTQGGTPNATADFTDCTNLSVATVPRVLAQWSQPGYFTVGSNYTVSLVAFHYSAQQRRPVRAVQFWAKDSAGNVSPTNTVLNPIIDWTQPDAVPIIEYVGTIDGSGFAQGSTISNYAAVFPWYGRALDFSDGVNPPNAADYAPLITYCDKSNTWPKVYAIVDPRASTSGKAVTTLAEATNGTAIPFGTLADALNACGATNEAVYGNNTLGNCFVLCTNGCYSVWGGPDLSRRNPSKSWTTIAARPDVDWHKVIFTNVNNNLTGDKTLKLRIYNIVCAVSSHANTFGQGYGDVLIDACEVWTNTENVALVFACTNTWLRQTVIRGMRIFPNPSVNEANSWVKARGCTWTSFGGVDGPTTLINPALFLGNALLPDTCDRYSLANDVASIADPAIWAFNKLMNGVDYQVACGLQTNINIGVAFVQNVVESGENSDGITLDIMYSGRANEWCTNVLIWNNTVLGRYHPPYNLHGYATVSSDHCMDVNNVFAGKEVQFDVSQRDGNQTNRWSVLFSVGCFNNSSTEIGLAPGSAVGQNNAGVDLGFDGMASYFNVVTNSSAFCFVANKSWCGGNSSGLGDYHLQATSPIVSSSLTGPALLPFDIEGNPRGDADPPGAYSKVSSSMLPALQISGSARQVVISWPEEATNCVLETSDALAPDALWVPLTNGVILSGHAHCLTNATGNGAAFYRLRQR